MKVFAPENKKSDYKIFKHKFSNKIQSIAKKIVLFFKNIKNKKVKNSKFTELEKDYIKSFNDKKKVYKEKYYNIEQDLKEIKQDIAFIKNILIKMLDNKRKYVDDEQNLKEVYKKAKSL